ncbi:anti-anti-sigma regulatory factor [Candidatus Symbiobacter mobilis CR]|uniref:Anti-anti-sigma regulatory factor n=2 Tax=Candidatus Symbiobacter TaxID=1436289 RepID=U5N7C4_9BURK|nr:anti-anti-sigma regulatory factor [Candidatus Symbiobacter mobilis CR]
MIIPILRLDNVLLASIQIDLSDTEVLQFQTDVVNKISESDTLGIAIDITALEVVDSFMARVINETASMSRLLGAEVVICGIRPYVAMTLVEMGRDLIAADCAFNLSQGLEMLKNKIQARGDKYLASGDDYAQPDSV